MWTGTGDTRVLHHATSLPVEQVNVGGHRNQCQVLRQAKRCIHVSRSANLCAPLRRRPPALDGTREPGFTKQASRGCTTESKSFTRFLDDTRDRRVQAKLQTRIHRRAAGCGLRWPSRGGLLVGLLLLILVVVISSLALLSLSPRDSVLVILVVLVVVVLGKRGVVDLLAACSAK